ncbi:MAG: hypothetical protein AB7O73_07855, partial [Bacteroidia bacterium]
AGTYHTKNDFVISLLVKNAGVIWKQFSANPNGDVKLPTNVQMGVSKKLKKAPIRLIAVYDYLLKWNMKYVSPIDTTGTSNPFDNGETQDSTKFQRFYAKAGSNVDNFFRHMIFGVDLQLSKNFLIMLGYNYRRQREFSLPERRGINGLSLGIGLNVKKVNFSVSYNQMGFGAGSTILGLTYKL